MNTIGLITGQDADLPQALIEKFSISVFPFTVNGELIPDTASFYSLMRNSKNQSFTTSQPSVKVFQDLFTENFKKYQDLIVITISSHLSGTYNAADQAKKLFSEDEQKRIHLIDSQSASAGEALLILQAADDIASGKDVETIEEHIKQTLSQIHFLGAFDDPQWLQKGGRISMVQALVVKNMLKAGFRPILTMQDGKIVTKKIQKFVKDKVTALFTQFKEEADVTKPVHLVITHSDCEKDALTLKALIEKYNAAITVSFINVTSPVIGAHLGYDALLLAWMYL